MNRKITFATISLIVLISTSVVFAVTNTHSADFESGSSQFFSLTSSASLRQKNDLTIQFNINFESLPTSGNTMWLVDKKSEAGEDFSIYAVFMHNDAGTMKIKLRTTNGSSSSLIDNVVNWSPSTGVDYKVKITREDTSGDVKFFIDDVQQGATQTGATGTLHDDSDLGFYIGRYKSADGRFFDGKLDGLSIWSTNKDTAFDTCNLVGNETNLESLWLFDNSALDETANNNDLTNNNTVTFVETPLYTCATSVSVISDLIIFN